MKKKVDIVAFINQVNDLNKLPDNEYRTRDFRIGNNHFLECILHHVGCYNGFNYYTASELPKSVDKPGIIFDESAEHKHQFPDDSRRYYFIHHSLRKQK